MRIENENESFQKKIESWDREWDESFPWESRFRDRDESLAKVCLFCRQGKITWNIVVLRIPGIEKYNKAEHLCNKILNFYLRSNSDKHGSDQPVAVEAVIIQMSCDGGPQPQSPDSCTPAEENGSLTPQGSAASNPPLSQGQGGSVPPMSPDVINESTRLLQDDGQ